MKKLTTTVFAAVIALALSMPAWAQNNAPATKSAPAASSDKKDEKKSTKKSKKKDKKAATDKKAADKK